MERLKQTQIDGQDFVAKQQQTYASKFPWGPD